MFRLKIQFLYVEESPENQWFTSNISMYKGEET